MFNSYDDHAELVIEVRKEKLSYLSTYLIDVIEINRILNSIQRNNIELDLNDCIESVDYSDFQEFALDINKIENLGHLKFLHTLYLHNNCISKIDNLSN